MTSGRIIKKGGTVLPVQPVIKSLQRLINIHEDLIHISVQKTDIVKEGAIDKLQKILAQEQKHIRLLEQAELNRQQEVEVWFEKQQLPLDDVTITKMLSILTNEQARDVLEKATIALTNVITKLKQQEQLNRDLLHQSMQFVQISLNMLSPTIENINYGNKRDTEIKRSVFDSKA